MTNKRKEILKNKNVWYGVVIAGIILISSSLSFLVENAIRNYTKNKTAQMVENRIATEEKEGGNRKDTGQNPKNDEQEKETEEQSETENPQGDHGREDVEEKAEDEKKEAFDRNLETYRSEFDTEITGFGEDIAAFLDGREDEFRKAIADYIFSTFGGADVEAVNIKGFVSKGDHELTYRITIDLGGEELPYICSYNKNLGFFSLYSPNELQ